MTPHGHIRPGFNFSQYQLVDCTLSVKSSISVGIAYANVACAISASPKYNVNNHILRYCSVLQSHL